MEIKTNLLLVDDSEIITTGLKEVLCSIRNIEKIETAGTLAEAEEVITRREINTVILDIQLPDGSGLNFLKWIKNNHPRTIVMILSNMADDFHRNIAKKRGAHCFFDKSDDLNTLYTLFKTHPIERMREMFNISD